jgi:predicted Rdx family selenoprotein
VNEERDRLEIIYCVESGFLPFAAGLAKRIERKLGLTADLVEGHDGIWEVRLNGRIVHSNRRACGSMESGGRILREIAKRRSFTAAGPVSRDTAEPSREPPQRKGFRKEKEKDGRNRD